MYKIVWSTAAENDFLNILQYYMEEVSKELAKKISVTISRKVESLRFFPARTRKGRVKGTRELVIDRYPYIVVIAVNEEEKNVIVLNIIHTARKYPK